MTTRGFSRIAAAVAALALFGALSVGQANDYGPAKVAYDDYIKRPSLQMRTRGRLGIAQTGDPRALRILSASYAKPEDPRDHVKYLIASTAGMYLNHEAHVAMHREWREKHVDPIDAWLWFRSLKVHQEYMGEADSVAVARDAAKNLWIRAAAMEALADASGEQVLPLMMEMLPEVDKLKAGIERMVVLETMARMYNSRAHELGTDLFREVGLKFIPLMDAKATDARTKLVMARYFRDTFGGENLWVESRPWLDRLLNPAKPVDPANDKYGPPPPPTKFVGIEASGVRIVYVIDLSDSMMIPLSAKEKEDIKRPPPKPKGPVTGRDGDDGKRDGKAPEQPKEPEKGKERDIGDALPWDKITCRFDAAREYLKLSLKGLRPDQQFCVIVFGTEAKTLNSTKGLMPVTPQTIANAIRELNRISPGSATELRKHGTLMGDTNLHGGIHRAFKVKRGGLVKEQEYVDPTTWTEGADTIFILSDGDPTDDDWAVNDKRDRDDQTGDPESRTRLPDQEILRFPGPYGYRYEATFLPDDVQRLNLFRKCEIHCIGIGEATQSLLQQIAKAGGGQVKMVRGN